MDYFVFECELFFGISGIDCGVKEDVCLGDGSDEGEGGDGGDGVGIIDIS